MRLTLISKPEILAEYISDKLNLNSTLSSVPKTVLVDLFNCLFYASLHSEEGQMIRATFTLFSHKDSDLKNNPSQNLDKWNLYPFEEPLPFLIPIVVKLAKAADPWSTSIAVNYDDKGKLWIYGMIDQAIHSLSYLNFEKETRPDRPGLFETTIAGIGSLSVMKKFDLLATLKQEKLVSNYKDILKRGPISEVINEVILPFEKAISDYIINNHPLEDPLRFPKSSSLTFRKTISRILNKIKEYGHGGTLLIADEIGNLDIKYKLKYNRLPVAIIDFLKNSISHRYKLQEGLKSEAINPVQLKEIESLRKKSWDARNELKGAIRFIASQSCVDGLVVMNKKMVVNGFGAVIKDLISPSKIYIADNLNGTSVVAKESDHFGTRHRSMFAFCDANPGSIGFVISQDGDIRAIMKIKNRVVMWENIKTQKSFRSKPVKELQMKIKT
jgi:hypothetical protein